MVNNSELVKVRFLFDQVQKKQEYCDKLRSMVESPQSIRIKDDKVQTDHDIHRFERIMSELADEERELQDLQNKYFDYQIGVIKKIGKLDNDLQRIVLHNHYIDYKKLTDISEELSYSYDHIKRTHRKALESYAKLDHESI